jgi:hypothetical protein
MPEHSRYPELKNEISERVEQSREIRKRIRLSRDRERYDAWKEKRGWGQVTRVLLLLRAFLRGRPYKTVEGKTHDTQFTHSLVFLLKEAAEKRSFKISRERVEAWFEADPAEKAEVAA